MIARLVRMLVMFQLISVVLLSLPIYTYFLPGKFGLSIALGVCIVLFARAVITANTFLLSRRYGSPIPSSAQVGPFAAARLFFIEFVSTMQSSSWTMAFCNFETRCVADPASLPVLLIHGYGCNSGYWHAMSKALTEARISHHAVTLEPLLVSIDDYVPAIRQAISQLQADYGTGRHDRIILVGHSMGGLACRAYLRAHGDQGIAALITIGTPHSGTAIANHGIGTNAEQMAMTRCVTGFDSSPWLQALSESETPRHRALITSIYSYHDNIVAPQSSSHLDGANNIALNGIGHVALALNKQVQRLVVKHILAAT